MVPLLWLTTLQEELYKYQSKVLLNRNFTSDDLIAISSQYIKDYFLKHLTLLRLATASPISHNEEFSID